MARKSSQRRMQGQQRGSSWRFASQNQTVELTGRAARRHPPKAPKAPGFGSATRKARTVHAPAGAVHGHVSTRAHAAGHAKPVRLTGQKRTRAKKAATRSEMPTFDGVSLSTLQKRARDKESRLRKKGASADAIGSVSPRRAWADVKGMSVNEQRAYGAALMQFNHRSNAYRVLPHGGVIAKRDVLAQSVYIKGINERREQEAARIDAIGVANVPGARNIYGSIQERQRERVLREKDDSGRYTGRRHEYLGDVYGVSKVNEPTVPPKDRQTAEKRLDMFIEMAQRSYDERRENLRESVRSMLEGSGAEELAEFIDGMTDTQFDVLTQRTNFMDELSATYSRYAGFKSGQAKEAAQTVSLDEMAAKQDMSYLLATVVKRAVK